MSLFGSILRLGKGIAGVATGGISDKALSVLKTAGISSGVLHAPRQSLAVQKQLALMGAPRSRHAAIITDMRAPSGHRAGIKEAQTGLRRAVDNPGLWVSQDFVNRQSMKMAARDRGMTAARYAKQLGIEAEPETKAKPKASRKEATAAQLAARAKFTAMVKKGRT